MGEEYQMSLTEAPKSEEYSRMDENKLQPRLPYPDDINRKETTIAPKNESVTEIISTDKTDDSKDLIDTIQNSNEQIQKQIIPKEYAYIISELWKTMDRRGRMEFRHVHNRLKYITHEDLTTGQAIKYLKYCKAVEKKNRKKRYDYFPGRDKWVLPELKKPTIKNPKYQGFGTFANAIFMADEERESRIYEDYLSRKEEGTEED